MASICADSFAEFQEVAKSYQILVKNDPAKALVGEQLNFRMCKATAVVGQKMNMLVQQVKEREITIMDLQKKQSSEDEKARSKKFQAEKEMWAVKEHAAHKRKFSEMHDNDEDDQEEDSLADDEEVLRRVFEEVKFLVKQNPTCAGKTPIGVAFDEIRDLIATKPSACDEGNTMAFLIEVMELARKLVEKFKFDGRKGSISGSFRRMRKLLPQG